MELATRRKVGGLYTTLDIRSFFAHNSLMGKAPGKAHRQGLTIIELTDMFPSEDAASAWFESVLWPDGRCCGHCGSTRTSPVASRKPMPFWCSDCREYFSAKTGTAMQRSKIPLRKWAIAIYLCLTS